MKYIELYVVFVFSYLLSTTIRGLSRVRRQQYALSFMKTSKALQGNAKPIVQFRWSFWNADERLGSFVIFFRARLTYTFRFYS